MPLTLILALALIVLNLFAFCMFLINFTVYPLIDKNMIQPYLKDNESPKHDNDVDFKD